MKKVYIPNRSHHDFSQAKKYGDLVFITEGSVDRFNLSELFRAVVENMEDAEEGDYLLLSSLTIINILMAAYMTHKFGKINLLLYYNNDYITRTVSLENFD